MPLAWGATKCEHVLRRRSDNRSFRRFIVEVFHGVARELEHAVTEGLVRDWSVNAQLAGVVDFDRHRAHVRPDPPRWLVAAPRTSAPCTSPRPRIAGICTDAAGRPTAQRPRCC